MSNIVNSTRKNKHLTFDDRLTIEAMLKSQSTFSEIARTIGKDASTISKEVRKHRELAANNWTRRDDSGRVLNDECPKLAHSPYVCNGCKQKPYCHLKRLVYRAKSAQKDYEALKSESRTGIALNKASFWDTDRKLREGIKKGQHIYHIMQTEEIQASQATVYRYIKKGYCSFSPIELPRMVKFRSRKPRQLEYVPYGAKKGRAYEDFQQHIAANHITHWVEMDTVIGRVGGKVLLTMLFTNSNFMFGRLLPNKTAQAVTEQFQTLRQKFTDAGIPFASCFSLILTDNGGEFANIDGIKMNAAGTRETRLFYCDPMRSSQKPRVEKNHTLLRDILPKGANFDNLTQEKVDIIFSHINSTKRAVFNGKTAYEMFTHIYGTEAAHILGICKVPAENVVQTTKLLQILGVVAF
jgi:IS30 family transposase